MMKSGKDENLLDVLTQYVISRLLGKNATCRHLQQHNPSIFYGDIQMLYTPP